MSTAVGKVSCSTAQGGVLAAVRECQVISAIKLVYTHESPTGVYFFLAELLRFFGCRTQCQFEDCQAEDSPARTPANYAACLLRLRVHIEALHGF